MPSVAKLMVAAGALLMALAVLLGAFGAHALKAKVGAEALALWQTAVQYHAWHALGMLAAGLLALHADDTAWLRTAAALFAAGILFFSGSLYALALGAPRGLGALAPVGGLAFAGAWICFAAAALR
ncbi:MAG TPA: DUF423 domain-containing protein [Burkholderiales bacterium]|nr:DUF423 domain-containing protein [Burkholderiales bacterium]